MCACVRLSSIADACKCAVGVEAAAAAASGGVCGTMSPTSGVPFSYNFCFCEIDHKWLLLLMLSALQHLAFVVLNSAKLLNYVLKPVGSLIAHCFAVAGHLNGVHLVADRSVCMGQ